ncbi:hypothetical protein HMPREF9233_01013 [Actinobaculum massiliense ACS-171-V-Col2]|uniref:Uncharacterized protein n=1 Tax=Actinobaculum massiliense ACS-171-V-Col2 TaxID=883066 RepID=K9EW87_9ACTO|nr:hypothetical protein HMPREF9233_01013 [Actinobaculum massiliense ACS-171-V-Col2]
MSGCPLTASVNLVLSADNVVMFKTIKDKFCFCKS